MQIPIINDIFRPIRGRSASPSRLLFWRNLFGRDILVANTRKVSLGLPIRRWLLPLLEGIASRVQGVTQRPVITVDSDGGMVRLVILEGREVVAWGTAVMGEGDQSEEADLESVAQLQALLSDLPYRKGRVVTSLPLATSLIRHLSLPKINRRYFKQVVLSEVLDTIPFTEDEVDIAWWVKKNGIGHDVVAVITPKAAIDHQVQLLKAAGNRPAAAYPRALALAIATDEPDVIAVDLGLFSAAVVSARGGFPQVFHEVDYSTLSPVDKAKAVARIVEQAADDSTTMSEQTPEDMEEVEGKEVPVVLSGQLAGHGLLVQAIGELLDRDVSLSKPPFAYPEHFPVHEYTANLGLALADRSRSPGHSKIFRNKKTHANLLTDRHLGRKFPILPLALFAILIAMGFLALMATGRVDAVASDREMLSAQMVGLERQARGHRLEVARAGTIQKRIDETKELRVGLQAQFSALDAGMATLVSQLIALTNEGLPAQTQLSSIAQQGHKFILLGSADTYDGAIQYSEYLRRSGLFAGVRVLRVDSSGSGTTSEASQDTGYGAASFQIEVSLGLASEGPD